MTDRRGDVTDRTAWTLGDRLAIDPVYLPLIRSGTKCSTIRRGRIEVRLGQRLALTTKTEMIKVRVEDATQHRFDDLSDADARRDGFGSLAELREALLRHYPGLASDDVVSVIRFAVDAELSTNP